MTWIGEAPAVSNVLRDQDLRYSRIQRYYLFRRLTTVNSSLADVQTMIHYFSVCRRPCPMWALRYWYLHQEAYDKKFTWVLRLTCLILFCFQTCVRTAYSSSPDCQHKPLSSPNGLTQQPTSRVTKGFWLGADENSSARNHHVVLTSFLNVC